ncbi:MAG: hypothetical protein CSA97_01270 [Bacteroidetes bacterium]|nr:MAG: hypothetical protein CSA97_01270 [Bacteroidota bacterium]
MVFVGVNLDLSLDVEDLARCYWVEAARAVVLHPFYGRELSQEEEEVLSQLSADGGLVILDMTQGIFSDKRYDFVDYYVGSLRKWFPMPDGGYLEANGALLPSVEELKENVPFVSDQRDAMYLRGQYFRSGDAGLKCISVRLNKRAEGQSLDDIHRMSDFSLGVFAGVDIDATYRVRMDNFAQLFELRSSACRVARSPFASLDLVATSPLYFPMYVEDVLSVQSFFAGEGIYCPRLWPVDYPEVLVSDGVRYIYEHLLCVPVDQRYGAVEMQQIVNLMREL